MVPILAKQPPDTVVTVFNEERKQNEPNFLITVDKLLGAYVCGDLG